MTQPPSKKDESGDVVEFFHFSLGSALKLL
jgi:hypothetical protein